MTTIRIPPEITHEALAKALATLGLVLDGRPAGEVFAARPSGELARTAKCAALGCAREPSIRIGTRGYCARHAIAAMEEER